MYVHGCVDGVLDGDGGDGVREGDLDGLEFGVFLVVVGFLLNSSLGQAIFPLDMTVVQYCNGAHFALGMAV